MPVTVSWLFRRVGASGSHPMSGEFFGEFSWELYWLVAGVLFGAATGSFSAVVLERLPQRRSLGGRSTCVCGRQLAAWENLPVAGWVAAGGRARCCGASIPVWYLMFEVVAAASWGLAGWLWGGLGVAAAAASTLAGVFTVAVARR